MGVRKATEEERDGKKRAGWRERIESLKKNRINFQVCKPYHLWNIGITCYLLMCVFPLRVRRYTCRKKTRSVWLKGWKKKTLNVFSSGSLAHSPIPDHSKSKVYLCTDNLRSEEHTSEAASTTWSAHCNSSLLLASACATEMTCISEPLWEVLVV